MCSPMDLLCITVIRDRVEAQRSFICIATEYLYVIYRLKYHFMMKLFSATEETDKRVYTHEIQSYPGGNDAQ